MYNLIFGKRKKFEINTADVTYKVHYLGNVMTSIMKGDGCVDKAVNILWDNHVKHNGKAGIKMKLTLTQGGLEVETEASGVTEYYGHRIHYIIAHPLHPKLFVWVYQHVSKTLKTELRCHAVLCKRNRDAKLIAFMLNERLERTFAEYKREKKRMQATRLCNSKNKILLASQHTQMPMRKKSLSSTMKYYKPPIQRSMISAPKLDDVREDEEGEENEHIKEENERLSIISHSSISDEKEVYLVEEIKNENDLIIDENLLEELERCYSRIDDEEPTSSSLTSSPTSSSPGEIKAHITNKPNKLQTEDSSSLYSNTCDSGIEESFTINYEFGNDVEQLKHDKELIKAYDELKVRINSYKENDNFKMIENDENDDDEIKDSINTTTSSQNTIELNNYKIEAPHQHKPQNIDASSPTPSYTKVSYDYLGDLSKCDENKTSHIPLIKQSKSFKLKTKNTNTDQDSLHIRNPFKRLQLSSSSFSAYTTFKKHQEHKQKQQQEHENFIKQLQNENKTIRSASPKLNQNFERLAVIVD